MEELRGLCETNDSSNDDVDDDDEDDVISAAASNIASYLEEQDKKCKSLPPSASEIIKEAPEQSKRRKLDNSDKCDKKCDVDKNISNAETLKKQEEEMKQIEVDARLASKSKMSVAEQRREAMKRIVKETCTPEILTTKKKFKKITILTKMESNKAQTGPMSILHNCMKYGIKAKVWIRRYKGLRGVITGQIVAFDLHMNLAMIDIHEIYTIETWMIGEPLPKNRRNKKKGKNYTSDIVEKENKISLFLSNPPVQSVKENKVKKQSTIDYLKQFTEKMKGNPKPGVVSTSQDINSPNIITLSQSVIGLETTSVSKVISTPESEINKQSSLISDDLWSVLQKINKQIDCNHSHIVASNTVPHAVISNSRVTSLPTPHPFLAPPYMGPPPFNHHMRPPPATVVMGHPPATPYMGPPPATPYMGPPPAAPYMGPPPANRHMGPPPANPYMGPPPANFHMGLPPANLHMGPPPSNPFMGPPPTSHHMGPPPENLLMVPHVNMHMGPPPACPHMGPPPTNPHMVPPPTNPHMVPPPTNPHMVPQPTGTHIGPFPPPPPYFLPPPLHSPLPTNLISHDKTSMQSQSSPIEAVSESSRSTLSSSSTPTRITETPVDSQIQSSSTNIHITPVLSPSHVSIVHSIHTPALTQPVPINSNSQEVVTSNTTKSSQLKVSKSTHSYKDAGHLDPHIHSKNDNAKNIAPKETSTSARIKIEKEELVSAVCDPRLSKNRDICPSQNDSQKQPIKQRGLSSNLNLTAMEKAVILNNFSMTQNESFANTSSEMTIKSPSKQKQSKKQKGKKRSKQDNRSVESKVDGIKCLNEIVMDSDSESSDGHAVMLPESIYLTSASVKPSSNERMNEPFLFISRQLEQRIQVLREQEVNEKREGIHMSDVIHESEKIAKSKNSARLNTKMKSRKLLRDLTEMDIQRILGSIHDNKSSNRVVVANTGINDNKDTSSKGELILNMKVKQELISPEDEVCTKEGKETLAEDLHDKIVTTADAIPLSSNVIQEKCNDPVTTKPVGQGGVCNVSVFSSALSVDSPKQKKSDNVKEKECSGKYTVEKNDLREDEDIQSSHKCIIKGDFVTMHGSARTKGFITNTFSKKLNTEKKSKICESNKDIHVNIFSKGNLCSIPENEMLDVDSNMNNKCTFVFHSVAKRLKLIKTCRPLLRIEGKIIKSEIINITPLFETTMMKGELSSADEESNTCALNPDDSKHPISNEVVNVGKQPDNITNNFEALKRKSKKDKKLKKKKSKKGKKRKNRTEKDSVSTDDNDDNDNMLTRLESVSPDPFDDTMESMPSNQPDMRSGRLESVSYAPLDYNMKDDILESISPGPLGDNMVMDTLEPVSPCPLGDNMQSPRLESVSPEPFDDDDSFSSTLQIVSPKPLCESTSSCKLESVSPASLSDEMRHQKSYTKLEKEEGRYKSERDGHKHKIKKSGDDVRKYPKDLEREHDTSDGRFYKQKDREVVRHGKHTGEKNNRLIFEEISDHEDNQVDGSGAIVEHFSEVSDDDDDRKRNAKHKLKKKHKRYTPSDISDGSGHHINVYTQGFHCIDKPGRCTIPVSDVSRSKLPSKDFCGKGPPKEQIEKYYTKMKDLPREKNHPGKDDFQKHDIPGLTWQDKDTDEGDMDTDEGDLCISEEIFEQDVFPIGKIPFNTDTSNIPSIEMQELDVQTNNVIVSLKKEKSKSHKDSCERSNGSPKQANIQENIHADEISVCGYSEKEMDVCKSTTKSIGIEEQKQSQNDTASLHDHKNKEISGSYKHVDCHLPKKIDHISTDAVTATLCSSKHNKHNNVSENNTTEASVLACSARSPDLPTVKNGGELVDDVVTCFDMEDKNAVSEACKTDQVTMSNIEEGEIETSKTVNDELCSTDHIISEDKEKPRKIKTDIAEDDVEKHSIHDDIDSSNIEDEELSVLDVSNELFNENEIDMNTEDINQQTSLYQDTGRNKERELGCPGEIDKSDKDVQSTRLLRRKSARSKDVKCSGANDKATEEVESKRRSSRRVVEKNNEAGGSNRAERRGKRSEKVGVTTGERKTETEKKSTKTAKSRGRGIKAVNDTIKNDLPDDEVGLSTEEKEEKATRKSPRKQKACDNNEIKKNQQSTDVVKTTNTMNAETKFNAAGKLSKKSGDKTLEIVDFEDDTEIDKHKGDDSDMSNEIYSENVNVDKAEEVKHDSVTCFQTEDGERELHSLDSNISREPQNQLHIEVQDVTVKRLSETKQPIHCDSLYNEEKGEKGTYLVSTKSETEMKEITMEDNRGMCINTEILKSNITVCIANTTVVSNKDVSMHGLELSHVCTEVSAVSNFGVTHENISDNETLEERSDNEMLDEMSEMSVRENEYNANAKDAHMDGISDVSDNEENISQCSRERKVNKERNSSCTGAKVEGQNADARRGHKDNVDISDVSDEEKHTDVGKDNGENVRKISDISDIDEDEDGDKKSHGKGNTIKLTKNIPRLEKDLGELSDISDISDEGKVSDITVMENAQICDNICNRDGGGTTEVVGVVNKDELSGIQIEEISSTEDGEISSSEDGEISDKGECKVSHKKKGEISNKETVKERKMKKKDVELFKKEEGEITDNDDDEKVYINKKKNTSSHKSSGERRKSSKSSHRRIRVSIHGGISKIVRSSSRNLDFEPEKDKDFDFPIEKDIEEYTDENVTSHVKMKSMVRRSSKPSRSSSHEDHREKHKSDKEAMRKGSRSSSNERLRKSKDKDEETRSRASHNERKEKSKKTRVSIRDVCEKTKRDALETRDLRKKLQVERVKLKIEQVVRNRQREKVNELRKKLVKQAYEDEKLRRRRRAHKDVVEETDNKHRRKSSRSSSKDIGSVDVDEVAKPTIRKDDEVKGIDTDAARVYESKWRRSLKKDSRVNLEAVQRYEEKWGKTVTKDISKKSKSRRDKPGSKESSNTDMDIVAVQRYEEKWGKTCKEDNKSVEVRKMTEGEEPEAVPEDDKMEKTEKGEEQGEKGDDEDVLVASEEEAVEEQAVEEQSDDLSQLNIYQRRKFAATTLRRVKRTNTGTEKINSEKESQDDEEDVQLEASKSKILYDSKEPGGFLARRMQHRLQVEQERQQKWEREKQMRIMKEIEPINIQPKKEVKGSIFKQRYVNQLFIRGDNIVMIAYERPEDVKKIKELSFGTGVT